MRSVAAIFATLGLAVTPVVAQAPKLKVFRLADNVANPQLGVDGRGNALAAWQQDAPKLGGIRFERTSAVFVSRRRAAGGFGKPRAITRLDLAVTGYALEVGPAGDGAIVWRPEGRTEPLYVNRARPGEDLGSPAALPGSRAAGEHVAAIDARGRLLVAWLRPARRERCGLVVMATVAPRGGAFRRPRRISDPCAHAGYLRAALARDGDGAVAWRGAGARSSVSRSTIQVSAFAGGRFRPPRAVSAVGGVGETLALAAGGHRVLAVWRDKAQGASRVLAAGIDGSRVAPPVEVLSTRDAVLSDVHVAMGAGDAAIVAWHRAPRGSSVWDAFATGEVAIRATADGAFGPPDVVARQIETASDHGLTGVALDARGGAMVGYGASVRRRAPGGQWGPAVVLERGDPEWGAVGDQISVGLGDAGQGVAAWVLEGADGGTEYMRAAVIPAQG